MTKKPRYWNIAVKYLSSKDVVMKKLIKKYDDKILTTRGDIFFSLCKSIIGQQISVAAADSVFSKFSIIFAPKEFSEKQVVLRNMLDRTEKHVSLEELITNPKDILNL